MQQTRVKTINEAEDNQTKLHARLGLQQTLTMNDADTTNIQPEEEENARLTMEVEEEDDGTRNLAPTARIHLTLSFTSPTILHRQPHAYSPALNSYLHPISHRLTS